MLLVVKATSLQPTIYTSRLGQSLMESSKNETRCLAASSAAAICLLR